MKETLETVPKRSIVVSIHGHGSACRSVHGEGNVLSIKNQIGYTAECNSLNKIGEYVKS